MKAWLVVAGPRNSSQPVTSELNPKRRLDGRPRRGQRLVIDPVKLTSSKYWIPSTHQSFYVHAGILKYSKLFCTPRLENRTRRTKSHAPAGFVPSRGSMSATAYIRGHWHVKQGRSLSFMREDSKAQGCDRVDSQCPTTAIRKLENIVGSTSKNSVASRCPVFAPHMHSRFVSSTRSILTTVCSSCILQETILLTCRLHSSCQ